MTVMEINLKDSESKDREQKRTADDNLALLLDSIDKETTDLTEVVLEEESLRDDIALGGEKDLAWLDSGLFEGDDLELDLKSADDSARASTEIESKEQDSKNEMDTSVDTEDEDENIMVDKEVTSEVSEETAVVGASNELASMMNKKIEEVVSRLVEKRISAIAEKSAKNPADDHESESTVEGQRETDREKIGSDALANELADLMSKRIEMIAARLLKEPMPVIAEPIILETMRKILLSME
jgi:hypothetical protein